MYGSYTIVICLNVLSNYASSNDLLNNRFYITNNSLMLNLADFNIVLGNVLYIYFHSMPFVFLFKSMATSFNVLYDY